MFQKLGCGLYQEHARMGIWKSTVTEEYEPYIRPQECGNHIGVKWVTLEGEECICFKGEQPFEFSALHFTMEEPDEKQHAFELQQSDTTEVIIACKNRGIGSESCGPRLSEKYQVQEIFYPVFIHYSPRKSQNNKGLFSWTIDYSLIIGHYLREKQEG